MQLEARARITLILPAPNNPEQINFLEAILGQLVHLYEGITASSIDVALENRAVFEGRRLDEGEVISSPNVICITSDALVDMGNPKLQEYLPETKRSCQRNLEQKVVWLTVHRIERVSDDDFLL